MITGREPAFVNKSPIVIEHQSDEAAADEAYIRAVNCVRELAVNRRVVK
jgi:hypothetical protein